MARSSNETATFGLRLAASEELPRQKEEHTDTTASQNAVLRFPRDFCGQPDLLLVLTPLHSVH